MRIRFDCRHCGAGISASDWDSGRAVLCSACRSENIVPAEQAPAISVGAGAVRDLSIRGGSPWKPHRRNYFLWGFAWSGIALAVIGVCFGGLIALSRASRDPVAELAPVAVNNAVLVRERVPVVPALPAFGVANENLFESLKDTPVKGQDRATFLEMRRSRPKLGDHPLALAIARQPSAGLGMPFTFGTDCTSSEEHSRDLGRASVALHRFLDSGTINCGVKPQPATLEQDSRWLTAEMVPSLTQILMVEDARWRQTLVNMLRKIDGPGATRGLVDRAVFDMDGSVRASAVAALRERPTEEYTDRLLSAFRHPWAPAADHAAQAIAALGRTDLESALRELVDRPDPTAPTVKHMGIRDVTVQPQLVRVNHLRNCTYCHPTSSSENDAVRGVSPDWDQPLPEQGYHGSPQDNFVRADMVYLRQDFSLLMPVGPEDSKNNWPNQQRFDFFVFDRPITTEEAAKYQPGSTYPQREAVRYALTKLEKTAPK
ncbi:MAG TPA: hypothetical protein VHR72_09865 [Gemmataceae bacterium]|jgi:hypothetical protein|nr:hypothetical protein [Gemmataceae bacterium]